MQPFEQQPSDLWFRDMGQRPIILSPEHLISWIDHQAEVRESLQRRLDKTQHALLRYQQDREAYDACLYLFITLELAEKSAFLESILVDRENRDRVFGKCKECLDKYDTLSTDSKDAISSFANLILNNEYRQRQQRDQTAQSTVLDPSLFGNDQFVYGNSPANS